MEKTSTCYVVEEIFDVIERSRGKVSMRDLSDTFMLLHLAALQDVISKDLGNVDAYKANVIRQYHAALDDTIKDAVNEVDFRKNIW